MSTTQSNHINERQDVAAGLLLSTEEKIKSSTTTTAATSSPSSSSSLFMLTTPTPSPFFFADATLDLDTAHDLAETSNHQITNTTTTTTTATTTTKNFASSKRKVSTKDDDDDDEARAEEDPLRPSKFFWMELPTLGTTEIIHHHQQQQEEEGETQSNRREMTQIIHLDDNNTSNNYRPAKWPRDLSWTIAFFSFVPVGLILPCLFFFWGMHHRFPKNNNNNNNDNDASAPPIPPSKKEDVPLTVAGLHALWWCAIVCFFLSRFFYRLPLPGLDGEDNRLVLLQALSAATTVAIVVYAAMVLATYHRFGILAALFFVYFFISQLLLVRRQIQRGDKQAFFQALANMALDILVQSLRRITFFRVLSAILLVQTCVIFLWRWALLGALLRKSTLLFLVALLAGKWATGTIARFISFLVSGGIFSWFLEQARNISSSPTDHIQNDDDIINNNNNLQPNNSDMPEAYRSVDASVYQSVMEVQSLLNDNDEDEDDEDDDENNPFVEEEFGRRRRSRKRNIVPDELLHLPEKVRWTVRSLLFAALTVSFGSIVQCGLLGGLAQFLWSQMRKIDTAQSVYSQWKEAFVHLRNNNNNNNNNNSTGNNTAVTNTSLPQQQPSSSSSIWKRLGLGTWLWEACRNFVRRHHDLAMVHVAAYSKNYQKAALDVSVLIDASGVEPILREDITAHMCSSLGGSISGIICLFTGYVLSEQLDPNREEETLVLPDLLISFVLCYTLIFTVLEPLRAGIKAVYVSFAQHPQSLRQSYPLIYARLKRLSEANTVGSKNNPSVG